MRFTVHKVWTAKGKWRKPRKNEEFQGKKQLHLIVTPLRCVEQYELIWEKDVHLRMEQIPTETHGIFFEFSRSKEGSNLDFGGVFHPAFHAFWEGNDPRQFPGFLLIDLLCHR